MQDVKRSSISQELTLQMNRRFQSFVNFMCVHISKLMDPGMRVQNRN